MLDHLDDRCRSIYRKIARDCRRHGLDHREIFQSVTELSETIGFTTFVRSRAYQPTGVALGCPLPDPQVARLLWRLAKLMDARLKLLFGGPGPHFAFVPAASYHITVWNRSYYKQGPVTMLT